MRRLAVTAFSFSAAIFLSNLLYPSAVLWWLAGVFALLGVAVLLFRQKWMLGLALASFGLSAGFLCYSVHAVRTLEPAIRMDGQSLELRGEILSFPQGYDGYCRADVRITSPELPRLNILLYADGSVLADAKPGDTVSCVCKLKRADQRYGEQYDRYLSRDIYLIANALEEPGLQESGFSLRSIPVLVNRRLAEKIDSVFPKDVSPFMKSLMLGDRTDYYKDTSLYLAMNRSGFMHIVAVSGMHVAFLVGLIQLLFGKTKRSSLLCLALVWFFVFVSGASPSALRAAIMQSFLLTAPLVQRENDPATSLSTALALILLANPFACASVSLQLSFASMAGILCLAEPLTATLEKLFTENWAQRLRVFITIAASSLSVLAFTVPLSVYHFHAIPLLSPLTNILGLWAVSFCFGGGYLCCLLGFLYLPLGRLAAWLVAWIARYLFLVARTVSSVSFATIYVKDLLPVLWILLVYLLVACAFFSKLSTGKKLLLPFACAALTLSILLGISGYNYRSGLGVISVIDVGQGQCIAVMSKDQTLLIDCGGIYSTDNAGERAGEYLLACGRDHVDAIILTHLHRDHCNGVSYLMEMLPVERLIVAQGCLDEDGMWEEILSAAQKHGTKIDLISEDMVMDLGMISTRLYLSGTDGEAAERGLMLSVSLDDYDMLVTGDASKSVERSLVQNYELHDMELLIVGHHGSRYASSGDLLGSIGADTAVISVGFNPFGHPTYETLERLDAYGYNIYRTDLNGTVEIRLREYDG